jgi:uncharacterized protein (DUF1015 family)
VYDGGGAASEALRTVDQQPALAETTTPDGLSHRLWAITDPGVLAAVGEDLSTRRALIADGHHRYATYQERQRRERASAGSGPWDRGLALVVDSTEYGPQVHPIHRVVHGLELDQAVTRLEGWAAVTEVPDAADRALGQLADLPGFAVVLTNGERSYLLRDDAGRLAAAAARPADPPALSRLDVSVLHRGLVERAWELADDERTVGYAHDVVEAVRDAQPNGFAVLVRPTPVAAVAEIAAAGARMPRKSTLFTPKPASGLVIRRLADQT